MIDHPAPESFAALIAGKLGQDERRRVVRHLIAGCSECREFAAEAYRVLDHRRFATAQRHRPEIYEFPVRHAVRAAREAIARLDHERDCAAREVAYALEGEHHPPGALPSGDPAGTRGWARAEQLLAYVDRFRGHAPLRALGAAQLAVAVAARLDPEAHPPGHVADLSSKAWMELGNAHRLIGDFGAAERALVAGQELWEEGTGDRNLAAELLERGASLLIDQRRFGEAGKLIDRLIVFRRAAGDPSLVAKALVLQGIAAVYGEDPFAARRLFLAALKELEPKTEGRLILIVFHNLVDCEILLDRFDEARRAQVALAPLYRRHGGEIDRLKRRGQAGKIEAGLGHLDAAEAIFLENRAAYERQGMPNYVASTALELAAVWVRQGRFVEVFKVADQLIGSWSALRIGREALAALLLLREAARTDEATTALVRTVAAQVERGGKTI